jgi:hypothetical protein
MTSSKAGRPATELESSVADSPLRDARNPAGFRRLSWLQFRGMAPHPSGPFFGQFARAAAGAGLFELKVRLFADNTPALQKHKEDALEALVKLVIEHEQASIDQDDVTLLKACVRLRNKLLHADFSKAAGTLVSFGVKLDRGRVHIVDLSDGAARKVSETSTTDGRVFGWVLEGGRSGVFLQACLVFRRGIGLINWRLQVASRGGTTQ